LEWGTWRKIQLTVSARYAQLARRKQTVIRWGARPHHQAYPAHLRVLVASKFIIPLLRLRGASGVMKQRIREEVEKHS
jgi:hypothetical protein